MENFNIHELLPHSPSCGFPPKVTLVTRDRNLHLQE